MIQPPEELQLCSPNYSATMSASSKKNSKVDDASQDEITKVAGAPAKDFFVRMLTRDIDLQDAILDLLDNCIDGILRNENPSPNQAKPFKGFWAKISFSGDRFVIEDNCGGIPWPLARDYAFRMGPADAPHPDRSIGTVGIGMKRAIFKLGAEGLVHSHHKNHTFEVSIPPSWFKEPKTWDFPATVEPAIQKEHGTIIEVTQLHPGIAAQFAGGEKSAFHERMLTTIGLHYCYMIEKGFHVEVNKAPAKGKPVEILCQSTKEERAFLPYIFEKSIGGVDIFLAVGYVAGNPTQKQQDQAVDGQYTTELSGWTIVCNDRVVVANDKTRLTGWGDAGVPAHHPQFNGIRGIVEFRSKNASDLPVTTTKRGIDAGSNLYFQIRERMQFALKRFTGNTNRWKGHEETQKRELKEATPLSLEELKEAVRKHKYGMNLKAISGSVAEKHFVPDLPVWEEPKTHRTITFSRPIRDIEKVSVYLFGNDQRAAAEVGAMCFDRTLKEAKK